MKLFRFFPLLVLALSTVSCISTSYEINKRQWENCEKLCGGKLSAAGSAFFSTEKTCLCENQVRFRYEGKKAKVEDDEAEE